MNWLITGKGAMYLTEGKKNEFSTIPRQPTLFDPPALQDNQVQMKPAHLSPPVEKPTSDSTPSIQPSQPESKPPTPPIKTVVEENNQPLQPENKPPFPTVKTTVEERKIEQIVFFFTDGSFKSYNG